MKRAFTLALTLVALPAAGQDLVLRGNLSERLATSRPMRGASVVGLSFGSLAGPIDLDSMSVVLPRGSVPRVVCVEATTRDGGYFANGPFEVPIGALGTARLSYKSRYAAELRRYGRKDLALTAWLATSCERKFDGILIPIRYPGESNLLTISIHLPKGSDLKASVDLGASGRYAMRCVNVWDEKSIAYGVSCQASTPRCESSASQTLTISWLDEDDKPMRLEQRVQLCT